MPRGERAIGDTVRSRQRCLLAVGVRLLGVIFPWVGIYSVFVAVAWSPNTPGSISLVRQAPGHRGSSRDPYMYMYNKER